MVHVNNVGVVLLIIASASQSSCVSLLFGPPNVKSGQYALITLPKPWTKIDPGTADTAYQNQSDRATISLNSVCHQYQDQSLDELAAGLQLGLTDFHVHNVEKHAVDGLPALRTTLSGRVDDAEVTVSYTVLRSADCVYDFILVARPETFAQHQQTYIDLVQAFHEGKAH